MTLAAVLEKADAIWRKLGRTLSIIGGTTAIITTIAVVADVSRRYLLNSPIPGVSDGVVLVMPYIVFPALAYALVTGAHVRVTLLTDRLKPRLQLWADSFACIIGLFFLGVLTYYGWLYFWASFMANEFLMAQIYLPMWAAKFAMPLGTFVFFVQYVLRLLDNVRRLVNRIEADHGTTHGRILPE